VIEMWDRFRKDKKKKPKKLEMVNKGNLKAFLNEVSKSINANFSGQESVALQKDLENEFNVWLKNTIFAGKSLDPEAIKIGVVLGVLQTLRKINEAEEKTKVTYIN